MVAVAAKKMAKREWPSDRKTRTSLEKKFKKEGTMRARKKEQKTVVKKERLLIPLFSWIGKKIGPNKIPILSTKHKTQRGGTCMLNAITTMLNAKLRMKYARMGKLVPFKFYTPSSRWIYNSRRAIAPEEMFSKILRVGLPTSKYKINPASYKQWYRVRGSLKSFKGDRVSELYYSLMDKIEGGPFVAVLLPDDDFPNRHFPPKKVWHGKCRVDGVTRFRKNPNMIQHMVTVVGLGREVVRTHWSDDTYTDDIKCHYWDFENSYGPSYGFGKVNIGAILDAFTFSLKLDP